ncbi:MAG: hypothetical protein ACRD98_10965 [Nitrososphaera sp.]
MIVHHSGILSQATNVSSSRKSGFLPGWNGIEATGRLEPDSGLHDVDGVPEI